MSKINIRSAYANRKSHPKLFSAPSMAHQSFKQECDINRIMKNFEKTGLMSHVNVHQGDYGDFTDFESYHDSMNQVLAAQEMFQSIPA